MLTEKEAQFLVEQAMEKRAGWFDDRHVSAFRLFNGFNEGFPDLSIDLYARTLVLFVYADPPEPVQSLIDSLWKYLQGVFPWIKSILVKTRAARDEAARRGALVSGSSLDRRIQEHGVWYALDLNRGFDASLYLDTRLLRRWILNHSAGMRVLNCFAYTGSLGVASTAGSASQVIHLDRNRTSLNLAKDSYSLNGFPVQRLDFVTDDFFKWTSRMRRANQQFDLVLLDPPFFSQSPAGTVDLNAQTDRLINKVRPLLADGGLLVAINNALFVSGTTYLQQLDKLCQDGFLSVEELIPVPLDFAGFQPTHQNVYPTDPAPFNHPTKIAVLKSRRNSQT
jgi:23S rRNA (cytosine1962-C5)-methyltransferase